MPDEKVLQVAILIWGCAFCAIAALCIFLSSNYDREKRWYLILTMTELNQEIYQLISREGKIKERLEIATILNKCIAELISGEDEDAGYYQAAGRSFKQ